MRISNWRWLHRVMIGLSLSLVFGTAQARHRAVGRGPFRIRSQTPIDFPFLAPITDSSFVAAKGDFLLDTNITWTNTFVGSNPLKEAGPEDERAEMTQALFDGVLDANPGEDLFYVDTETERLSLSAYYGLSERVQVGIEVPVLRYGGGTQDSFIEGFHRALGLTGAGRDRIELNDFALGFRFGRESLFLSRPPGTGLGDISLRTLVHLRHARERGPEVSAALTWKLPTGDAEEFFGSGYPDIGLNLILEQALGNRQFLYVNLGYTHLGGWALVPSLKISDLYTFAVAYEVQWRDRTSFVGQILRTSSPFRSATNTDMGHFRYEVSVGAKVDFTPRIELVASLTENIVELNNSLDIGYHLGLVCLF